MDGSEFEIEDRKRFFNELRLKIDTVQRSARLNRILADINLNNTINKNK